MGTYNHKMIYPGGGSEDEFKKEKKKSFKPVKICKVCIIA